MIFDSIHSKLFWTVLLYYLSIILGVAFRREANGQAQLFFRIKQGVRSQRKAFISLRAKTSIHCAVFCLEEKTCKSLNYAEYTSVTDGQENCELHNETKNDDGNSLEFLKDDRYTFYQILGASHEPENTQTTENVTEQANTPPLTKRSCLEHFNSGWKTSGNYPIVYGSVPVTLYCDMESEPGSVWTLVMSFTRANKDAGPFKSKPLYESNAQSRFTPNWSKYRLGLTLMATLKTRTTHWRITCSFPQYGVDINTDYVRAVFADFDLLSEFKNECKNVSYISVMGQSCSECTAHWRHGNDSIPHIAAVPHDFCDIKSDKSGNSYFGAYQKYNTTFRCTETPTSTTNYWFGSYV